MGFGGFWMGFGGFGWVLVGLDGFWWVWMGFGGFYNMKKKDFHCLFCDLFL